MIFLQLKRSLCRILSTIPLNRSYLEHISDTEMCGFCSATAITQKKASLLRTVTERQGVLLILSTFPISKPLIPFRNRATRNTRFSASICQMRLGFDRMVSEFEPRENVETIFVLFLDPFLKHTSRHHVVSDVIALQ